MLLMAMKGVTIWAGISNSEFMFAILIPTNYNSWSKFWFPSYVNYYYENT